MAKTYLFQRANFMSNFRKKGQKSRAFGADT